MQLIIRIAINAGALWVAIALLDGFSFDGDWLALLVIAVVLGVINVTVKPILKLLSLPIILLTLGLFLIVVNAISLWLVILLSEAMNLGLSSASFGWTVGAALVVSLVSWALETVTGRR